MPRRPRSRRIGTFPDHWRFYTEDTQDEETVILTLDEFETIRLIDRDGLTQEACAEKMGVSRPTVTASYDGARKKLARMIVDGTTLRISGGNYQIDEQQNAALSRLEQKGNEELRIAIPYENNEVFQHFGRTGQFKLYDAADGAITREQIVETTGLHHGALVGFLKGAQTDVLVCGGLGLGAQAALEEAGIQLVAGASGDADEAARAFIAGTLTHNPDAVHSHRGFPGRPEGFEGEGPEGREGGRCHGPCGPREGFEGEGPEGREGGRCHGPRGPREGFEGEGPEGREGGRCHSPRGPREGCEGPCRRRAEDTAPENGETPAENA